MTPRIDSTTGFRPSPQRRSIEEHHDIAVSMARPGDPVRLPVADAAGMVLAEDARATLHVPPFSNSAMDGFLVHRADVDPATAGPSPWTLPVAADTPAGAEAHAVPAGHAVRIMTGAAVGDPVDPTLLVIPVEDTNIPPGPVPLPEQVTINAAHLDHDHIRYRGANVSPGQPAVPRGTAIDAGTIAVLISTGVDTVSVYPAVRVAVVSSGDELVPAGIPLSDGQIPDSNSPMVAQLLREHGVSDITVTHVSDRPGPFAETMQQLADTHDLVITTGGVSAGAFDVTHQVASSQGVWFGNLNMKPGKPQGLGHWDEALLMCLPGNPVAAWVSFQLFVAPVLRVMAGQPRPAGLLDRPRLLAHAQEDFPLPTDRSLAVPVRLQLSGATPSGSAYNARGVLSHFVASLSGLGGIAIIDKNSGHVRAGDTINILLT